MIVEYAYILTEKTSLPANDELLVTDGVIIHSSEQHFLVSKKLLDNIRGKVHSPYLR